MLWEESSDRDLQIQGYIFLKRHADVEPVLQKVFATLLTIIVPICKQRDVLGKFVQEIDNFYF